MTPQDYKDILNNAGKWFIALLLVITVCYLTGIGKEVPNWLVGILSAVMGYYFCSSNSQKKAGE